MKKTILLLIFLFLVPIYTFAVTSGLCDYQTPTAVWELKSDLLDCSGNGRTLTNNNGAVINSLGANFTGVEYLSVNGDFLDLGFNDWTWCYNSTRSIVNTNNHIGGHFHVDNTGFRVFGVSGDIQKMSVYGGIVRTLDTLDTSQIDDYEYTCWRNNGSTMYSFRNGVLDNQALQDQNINTTTLTEFQIANIVGGGANWVGQILEMAFWDIALTDEQINDIYNSNFPLTVNWDSNIPTNNSLTNDVPIVFEFTTMGGDSNTQCSLLTNDTGTFIINSTRYGLIEGQNQINYTATENSVKNVQFYTSCNDSSASGNTSIKTMQIDFVTVFINFNNPTNNSIIFDSVNEINLNITYSNVNLDFVEYKLFHPNGTLFQTNISSGVGQPDFIFTDNVVLPVNRTGVWSIQAVGNDSAMNQNNVSMTFIIAPELFTSNSQVIGFIASIIGALIILSLVFAIFLKDSEGTTKQLFVGATIMLVGIGLSLVHYLGFVVVAVGVGVIATGLSKTK